MKLTEKHFVPFAGPVGTALIIVIWTALVLASLLAQREQLNRTAAELARIAAISNLQKDITIRKWASKVEGVFVREEHVPELDSLEQEERLTAIRNTGESFTIVGVTPMHLLLAIQSMTNEQNGRRERLTSKQLRNRNNAPDDWELKALDELENGANMITETLPDKAGHGLMRVMLPMRMEEECLSCHRDTLVPVGGLRGAATISVDLLTYRNAQEPTWRAIQTWHGVIWILGVATLMLLHLIALKRTRELSRQDQVRRENEMAFAAMAEGAAITDADGTILWVNDAFCRISGYDRQDVIGANPRILKSGVHDADFYHRLWDQLLGKGCWRGEIWNKRRNGEVFPEELSIQALTGPDGKISRFISIFSDITERKKNEIELAAYREHLEELVKQRTEELTIARDQAEAANRSKSVFLANMSHELRTPLNAVIGFSKLMERDPALSPENRRSLEIINHSGRHLLTLINDILELSKIESGKMEMSPEEVDLRELLEQAVDMMRLRAEEAGLELRLKTESLPAVVLLDPGMLRQVLLNLLSNAVKFTDHGEVVVHAAARPTGRGTVELSFSVRDTGIGISPEEQERIFSSFEQVGPSPRGGTGLGLTISRRYVEMMGGCLRVDSLPGEGSDFHFTIEAAVIDGAVRPAANTDAKPVIRLEQPASVLVVDDNQEGRLLVRSLLEPLGFVVEEAAGIGQARSIIRSHGIDLVLIGWYFPDGEGLDLIREFHGRGPALVMLTANATAESRAAALGAGADGFLSKPLVETELLRIIERVLLPRLASPAPKPAHCDIPQLREWLQGLPQEEREHLARAAISLNPVEIEAAIDVIGPSMPALAQHLKSLSRQRCYQELWEVLGLEGSET
ncbi:MAG: ATP-binding protein [Thiohalomonadaceae bacterium]